MKKSIIIIITITLVIIAAVTYSVYSNKTSKTEADKINTTYKSFYNQEVLGSDVISLINKTIDYNETNNIKKDNSGNYIENDTNSIKIDVKFSELNKVISMETINTQGINQFAKNFGAFSFKCTKIEYHEKTNIVKYLYFEQV